MDIVVLGAAGLTGRALVAQALADGHRVRAFARTPAKLGITHARLDVVQGDATDAAAVARAIAGQKAVLCALGNASPLKRDPALVAAVDGLVQAMERSGPRRLIYLSFVGVGERAQLGPLLGLLAPLLLRSEIADHAAKESAIRQSTLDWTIVRPPKMTDGPRTGAYRHGVDIAASSIVPTISRADVADFMLRQITERAYLRQVPAVMR